MRKRTLLRYIDRLENRVDVLEDEIEWARSRILALLDENGARLKREQEIEEAARRDIIE
jgi:regulator of replication initiation timing